MTIYLRIFPILSFKKIFDLIFRYKILKWFTIWCQFITRFRFSFVIWFNILMSSAPLIGFQPHDIPCGKEFFISLYLLHSFAIRFVTHQCQQEYMSSWCFILIDSSKQIACTALTSFPCRPQHLFHLNFINMDMYMNQL